MDLQLVPKVNISKDEREKWEEKMSEIVKDHEREFQEWYDKKLKAGYSEEEIDRMICF